MHWDPCYAWVFQCFFFSSVNFIHIGIQFNFSLLTYSLRTSGSVYLMNQDMINFIIIPCFFIKLQYIMQTFESKKRNTKDIHI